MAYETLAVVLEDVPNRPGEFIACSPALGVVLEAPARGQGIEPGGYVGALRILNSIVKLTLPETCSGVVLDVLIPQAHTGVGYGHPLFQIGPYVALTDQEACPQLADHGSEAGEITIKSPTDGIFYRRPDPESPPYTEVGETVERGATLGLVEVMKCFNHIHYGGKELPERAQVVAIIPKDTSEVKAGQILFQLSAVE